MDSLNGLTSLFLSQDGWVLQIFFVIVLMLLLDFMQRRVLRKLIKHAEEKTQNIWDDAVLHAAKRPISLIIWMVGLLVVSHLIHQAENKELVAVLSSVSDVGIIIAIAWFAIEFIRFAQAKLIETQKNKPSGDDSRIDHVTIEALCKLFRLAVIITAGIVILETLGFSISGILAFGGIGGIAIGFAAKDLLSNFFGGLMIYLDRPFAVGDWVRSEDREIEGTVEYIGWRQTRIRSFAKRPIYVPNSVFSNIVVENPSRMSHRRIYETLGVRYDDVKQVRAIVDDVKAMLLQHPEIDTTQTMIVNFNSFSASSVDFFVYTFTKTTNWIKYHEIKQDVLLKISDIVDAHGAEFAFPTSTLHVANASPEMAGLAVPKGMEE